jgi:hypothetical protein
MSPSPSVDAVRSDACWLIVDQSRQSDLTTGGAAVVTSVLYGNHTILSDEQSYVTNTGKKLRQNNSTGNWTMNVIGLNEFSAEVY